MTTTAPSLPAVHEHIVYIVSSGATTAARLERLLSEPGRRIQTYASGAALLAAPVEDLASCVLIGSATDARTRLALQHRLRLRRAGVPVIFLCRGLNVAHAVRALREGAFDVLAAPLRKETLRTTVALAVQKNRQQRQACSWRAELQRRHDSLTVRESQVLALVMEGMPNRQVADALMISEISVKVHRGNMMRKMAAASLVELVVMDEVLHPRAAPFARPLAVASGCPGLDHRVPPAWAWHGATLTDSILSPS